MATLPKFNTVQPFGQTGDTLNREQTKFQPATKPVSHNNRKMAIMMRDDPGNILFFHYNPEFINDNRNTQYGSEEVSETSSSRPQYDKTDSRKLFLQLNFDDASLNVSVMPVASQFSAFGQQRSVPGWKNTNDSIEWLRTMSMTIPGQQDSPPVMLFNGVKQHLSFKLFPCIITKVDVVSIWQEKFNPWRPIRATVSIELIEFMESNI